MDQASVHQKPEAISLHHRPSILDKTVGNKSVNQSFDSINQGFRACVDATICILFMISYL